MLSSRFKVDYFDKDPDGDRDHKVGEAEVLYIAPRHPNKGIKMVEPMTWKNLNDERRTSLGVFARASCERGRPTDVLLL